MDFTKICFLLPTWWSREQIICSNSVLNQYCFWLKLSWTLASRWFRNNYLNLRKSAAFSIKMTSRKKLLRHKARPSCMKFLLCKIATNLNLRLIFFLVSHALQSVFYTGVVFVLFVIYFVSKTKIIYIGDIALIQTKNLWLLGHLTV